MLYIAGDLRLCESEERDKLILKNWNNLVK